MKQLDSIAQSYDRSGYAKDLFDPKQTHAIYGVHKDYLVDLKNTLSKSGAYAFRLVKGKILCFNASKMI